MAPEVLNRKEYSTASDVWSYGCIIYEIWSLGQKPYEKDTSIAVREKALIKESASIIMQ